MKKEYLIETHWRAFPLHPEIPEEGLSMEALFKGRAVDLRAAKERVRQAAERFGLPVSDREMTYNTRLAQELGAWAETKGKGDEFHNAVFRAYFVDGMNIGKIASLIELAGSVGLPEDEAQRVLEGRAFREVVDFDWERSRRMGVTAVPTTVIGRQSLVGAQPYGAFEQLMEVCAVERRERFGAAAFDQV